MKLQEEEGITKKTAHPWAGKWRVWSRKECLNGCGNAKCKGIGSFTLKEVDDELIAENMNYIALREPFSDDPFTYTSPARIKNASTACKSKVELVFQGDISCGIQSIKLALQLSPNPTTGSINSQISCSYDVQLGSLYHRKGWDDFSDCNVTIWISKDEE